MNMNMKRLKPKCDDYDDVFSAFMLLNYYQKLEIVNQKNAI